MEGKNNIRRKRNQYSEKREEKKNTSKQMSTLRAQVITLNNSGNFYHLFSSLSLPLYSLIAIFVFKFLIIACPLGFIFTTDSIILHLYKTQRMRKWER